MIETKKYCVEGLPFPLVYEPTGTSRVHSQSDVLEYLTEHRDELFGELYRYGALLFRAFSVKGARDFREVVSVFAANLLSYQGGDSPRAAVADKVYTSTSYPPSLPILLHNEMSYTREYPSLIAFYCETPPNVDGETPLADCRQVLKSLSPDLLQRFKEKKTRYIQNLRAGAGIGKSWRETFETDDREKVESILRARGAKFQWKDDGSLRVSEVIEPIITHPKSGDAVFFSQAHLWHVSSLDAKTRAAMLKIMSEEDLYHHCTFGDGSRIGDEDLIEIRRALDAATIKFPWQKHDVLLVDNILVAHGRSPFKGERRILVAMG